MPISPVDTTWQDGGTQVTTQLPLRLCWAITMHMSQGHTLDKAVIDLRPKEAKRLVDLMVEPMSFDSIGNLGNSLTTKARLQEEVRLVELAQSTRVRYTDMGVTNEVPFSSRCTTMSMANKSPTGSLPPAVPLAITPTSRPWTHTSDDSYFYQLSLILATATVSFLVPVPGSMSLQPISYTNSTLLIVQVLPHYLRYTWYTRNTFHSSF